MHLSVQSVNHLKSLIMNTRSTFVKSIIGSFVILVMLLIPGRGWGQTILFETFNEATTSSTTGGTGMPSAYSTGDYVLSSGTWTFTNAIRGTTNVNSSPGCQIQSATGNNIITPTIVTGGVGIVSFYAAGTSAGAAVNVSISINGGAFSAGTSYTSLTTTSTLKQLTVNDASGNIRVKFARTAGTLTLDDITITTSEPTTQTSAITFPTVASTSVIINWTNGNGGRRAVFMKEGSGTITNPSDGVAYSAGTDWNLKGTQLGTSGYYCIYNGTGSTVSLTNLIASTTYYVQSFEYNSDNTTTPTATTINYFTNTATGNPNSQATSAGASPTKLVITSISPAIPTAGSNFSVTVQAQDASNNPSNVTSSTDISLTKATGTGALGGTTTGTITNGANSVTISGITYNTGETGVSITATATSGMTGLTAATSSTFTVLASQPTTVSSAMVFGSQTTTEIPLTSWTIGNGASRIVVRRAGGSATAPTNGTNYAVSSALGTGTVIYNGNSNTVTATGLTAGTQYSFDVYEYNGSSTTANYGSVYTSSRYTLQTEPSSHSATFTASAITTTTLTLTFTTTGTSGLGYIILQKAGSSPSNGIPVDGTGYAVGNTLGDGTVAAFVTANSTTTASITGLSIGTQYTFSIIPFGRVVTNVETYNYYIGGTIPTLTVSTLAIAPTTASSSSVFGAQTTSEIPLTSWTIGNGASRIVVRRAGGSATAPTNGTNYAVSSALGTGTVIYNGNSNTVTAMGLTAGTQYSFDIYEYNGISTTTNYGLVYTSSRYTLQTEPSSHSATFTSSAIASTSLTLNFTTTGTSGLGYIILQKTGSSPSTGIPVDGTGYAVGNTLGDGTVAAFVTTNSATTASITGLSVATQYTFSIIPFGRVTTNAETYNYYTGGSIPTLTISTLASAPTAASSVTITARTANSMGTSWTNGPGAGRIVIARLTATTAVPPFGGTAYIPNSPSFSDGLNPTTGTGNVVVYNGTGSSLTITGLSSSTFYKFDVYEYNGATVTLNYSTAASSATTSTLYAEPTTQASAVSFSAISAAQITISFTKGDGINRIVLVKSGSAVNSDPVDATSYTANAAFASGTQIGSGNYVVYNGVGQSITVTGLSANTTYYAAVYEFGGSGANINYLLTSPATGNQITLVAVPYAPASLTFGSLAYNSFTSTFSAPVVTPAGYLVLRRTGSAVTGTPAGGTVYSIGQTIGTGTVVYVGASAWSAFAQTGLTDNTTYHYAVYSYDGVGTQTNYSTSLSGSQLTSLISAPNSTDASAISSAGFSANWDALVGATNGYRLDVSNNVMFEGSAISENFGGFTVNNGGTDLSSVLNSYMQTSGWTGAQIYEMIGYSKMGSGNNRGILTTPTLDLSANGGNYTLTFDLSLYGSDGTLVQVLHAPDGTTYTQVGTDITPPASFATQTVQITGGTASSKIRIQGKSASSNRFYLDNILVSYSNKISGYTNLSVNAITKDVSGLTANTTYYYRVRAVGANSTSANSNVITTTTGKAIQSAATSNWNNTATWSPASIPTNIDDVTITASNPVNVDISTAVCANLTIATLGVLTINSGQALTISGTLTNSAGTTGLIIKSDAYGTGSLINASSGVNATVERYLSKYGVIGDEMYHFISSPVDAQPIRTEFVTSTPTAGQDFYAFDEVNNLWINTRADNGNWNGSFENNFGVGKGYLVAYPANVTKNFTGVLNTYASPLVLNCTNTSVTGSGWNLLGNPFPSAVDWDLVVRGDGMDDALYYYDAAAQNYRYYIQLTGVGTLGSGSRYIPAMQGFMVHAKTTGTKTVSIGNGNRVHTGQNVYYKSAETVPGSFSLTVNANGYEDAMFVHFNAAATTQFDGGYDAYKLSSYNDKVPQIYTMGSDNSKLAINGLPELSENVQIPVYFKAGNAGQQVITADVSQANSTVYLTDLKTSATQNLRMNPTYTFTAQDGDAINRFLLHFAGVGIDETTAASQPFSVYAANNTISIISKTGTGIEGNVYIYNLVGQLLVQQKLTGSSRAAIALTAPTGYYLVKVVTSKNTYTTKVFINR
ncbi:MAG: T9SS type A sorting domain-containing protein [Bacteroidetes bacterium]|nr:T9SS type A sorting domain-containing protein [Bacteroidota bacterium]